MAQKIVYLDGLRGLAACIVVAAHFFQVFLPSVFEGNSAIAHFAFEGVASRTPFNLLFNGNFSVCLFFVLSGYVLSHRFFQTKDRMIVYSSALRRYFRLAVPAFCSVILAYAVMRLGFSFFDEVRAVTWSSMPDPYSADPRFGAMVVEGLFRTFFHYGSQYNPVLWTMTYELFGSLLIFAFLVFFGKLRIRYLLYGLLIWHYIDSYYLGFILGLMLSDLQHSGRNWLAFLKRPWIIVALVALGVYAGSFPYVGTEGTMYAMLVWDAPGFPFFIFYHVLGSFFLILALLNSTRLQALFGSRVFAYLGKVSFSLYLVHFTIICSFSSFLFDQWKDVMPYGVNLAVVTLLSLPVIFAVSHVFYRYIDALTLKLLSAGSRRLLRRGKRGQSSVGIGG